MKDDSKLNIIQIISFPGMGITVGVWEVVASHGFLDISIFLLAVGKNVRNAIECVSSEL